MQRLPFFIYYFLKREKKKYKIGFKDIPKQVLRLCRALTSESFRANERRQHSAITDSSAAAATKNRQTGGRQQA